MDKIKKGSLKKSFARYLLICFIASVVGCMVIYGILDYFQIWYAEKYASIFIPDNFSPDDCELSKKLPDNMWLYDLMHYGKSVGMSLWTVLCSWVTVNIFHDRELKKPIDTLVSASDRILGDDLDFEISCDSKNELGQLCCSFENMRKNLYNSNYELWKSLEERKRLNSAFSHDLRTPITVLKGYTELVKKYDSRITQEKQTDILMKMSVQIDRLEHYTEKMSSLHKLEDIIPEETEIDFSLLCSQLEESGKLICGEKRFTVSAEKSDTQPIFTDHELVMQVFENLVSNAVRYAVSEIRCDVSLSDAVMAISVSDDGNGFSDEVMRKAWQPFYRGEKENEREHFGLGLYICRLLCRKCGGELYVGNTESGGGKVTAKFSVKKTESR